MNDLMIDYDRMILRETIDDRPIPRYDLFIDDGAIDLADCPIKRDLEMYLVQMGFEVENLRSTTEILRSSFSGKDLPRISSDSCDSWEEQITYFVTRYDYVNVFHTTWDLYQLWFTAQLESIPSLDDIQVIFLDGKPPGSLDHLWQTLTGPEPIRLSTIKNSNNHNRVQCYRRALFSCPSDNSRNNFYLRLSWGTASLQRHSQLWLSFRGFLREKFRR